MFASMDTGPRALDSCVRRTLLLASASPRCANHQLQRRRRLVLRCSVGTSGVLPGGRAGEYQVGGSWVVAPKRAVRGVVHFLGGAFAGASPQITYDLLVQLLSNAGYTVVATPYAVTFQHDSCARVVHQQFSDCLSQLRASKLAYLAPPDAPLVGVGHSNGALLHLLIGSLCEPANDANVIISFNNKQVVDAVPVPLDSIRPLVNDVLTRLQAAGIPDAQQIMQTLAAPLLQNGMVAAQQVSALAPALEQVGLVFAEVGAGASDFTPPPAEVRRIVAGSYAVPSTLLVAFEVDTIDETPEMVDILAGRSELSAQNILLPGSHVTPCGTDMLGSPVPSFGPSDAVTLALRGSMQADVRRLADRITLWLDAQLAGRRREAAGGP